MPALRLVSTVLAALGVVWHALSSAKVLLGIALTQGNWSLRRVRKGAALFIDPLTHMRVASIFRRRKLRPVAAADPMISYKYLTDYVATGLSRKERATILLHHYGVLSGRVPEESFRAILQEGLELWSHPVGDHTYSIALTFPRDYNSEGDLALVFRDGTTGLYVLSFTLGPGSIAGLDLPNVMYVARVQGKGKALEWIRTATRDCSDISPAALLLAAAEGIALELNLDRIIGISGSAQISLDKVQPADLTTPYDEFWMALGGARLESGMYQLMVPLAEKPIQAIKRCHRSRTRRKRAFRKTVSDSARARFHESILEPAVA